MMMCRRIRNLTVLCLLTTSLTLTGKAQQTSVGSIVVVAHSTDKVIIAADSRSTGSVSNDSNCKVSTFKSRIVFAAVGYTPFSTGMEHWDSHVEAHSALQRALGRSGGRLNSQTLLSAANNWGKRLAAFFERAAKADIEEFNRNIPAEKREMGNGVFCCIR
jgi:hypothetical protein